MHELSLAEGIYDIIRCYVPSTQGSKVRAVKVRVGRLSGVAASSLDFCFGAVVSGTPYEPAFLDIEQVPAALRCSACEATVEIDSPACLCPRCGSADVVLAAGTELQVVEVELDEGGGTPS
jgi:hydrogenase nickel incorporation protein HypA/HybF